MIDRIEAQIRHVFGKRNVYNDNLRIKQMELCTINGPLGIPRIATFFGSNDSHVNGLPGNGFD